MHYADETLEDLDAILIQGYNYYKLQKYREAIPYLQKIPEEHPNYLLNLLLLGDSFLGIENFEAAIETLKKGPTRIRNLDEHLLLLHYLLGMAYKAKGDKDKARNHLNKVYATNANYKDVEALLKSLS